MSIRARKDNVIYANFGKQTRVDTPPPAQTRRVRAESYQQGFLRDIYQNQADPGRISRGTAYSRNGNVVTFKVERDRIVAAVAGSQNEPFDVSVVFPPRSSEEIGNVTRMLLETPGMLGAVRAGRLTPDIVTALLADKPEEVRVYCDCPDRSIVCKHGVAVLETAAEKLPHNPGMLFELRGLNFAQLEQLMQNEAKAALEKAAVTTETFWAGKGLPPLPQPKVAPAIEDSDLDLLHKAMRTVSYTSVDELRAVSDLEDLYDFLVKPY